MAPNQSYPQHVVTAVIVAHDGAAWLPQVIDALLGQTRPVQRAVAVDTGSRDRSGSVLASRLGSSVVFGMDRHAGYATAVTRALRHKAANVPVSGSVGGQGIEWIWLLHDDCEPAPDALEQLLRGAAEIPSAAVLGPKLRDWSDRNVVIEAGLTIDTAGRRITGIEPREVDQGQHDGDRDMLAVGSAGMLIRRDVWDHLRGFDTSMTLFREDIDFCWRAHAAGYRVRLVTDAIAYHVQASARHRRAISVGRRARMLDRRNALLTLLGNLPLRPMLAAVVGNALLSASRIVYLLLAKRASAALDEFAAFGSATTAALRPAGARRRRARGRRAAYAVLRTHVPPGRSGRRLFETVAATLSRSRAGDGAGLHRAMDDPTEDDSLLIDTGIVARVLTHPSMLLLIALLVVTIVAERSLLGGGPLGGGALLPAWDGASDLWRSYVSSFHPVGVGSTTVAPPYLAVVALLATLLAGKTWLAVDVILLGCVPLAGLTAYLAVRRVTRLVAVRVWVAATYALLPVATGAISAGRIGTATAFVLIPVIGLQAGRMLGLPARQARRAAWATALTLAVGAAFVPLLWGLAMVMIIPVALVLARRGTRRSLAVNMAITAIVPVVLLLPWSAGLLAHPSRFLLEAGLARPGLASSHLSAQSLLLLSPGGPGLPPSWVSAGLVLAAATGLLARRRRMFVLAGWGMAVAGLAVALGESRATLVPPSGGTAVTAWPGAALAAVAAGLLLAVAAGADSLVLGLRGAGRGRSRLRGLASGSGLGLAVIGVAAISTPALCAAFWLTDGAGGPVAPTGGPEVPGLVSALAHPGYPARTLVLRQAGSAVSYLLLRGSSPTLGDGQFIPVPSAERALGTAVAGLVAPDGGEAVNQARLLARFDIGFVLMRAPISQAIVQRLDAVVGLTPVSLTKAFDVWRLDSGISELTLAEPDGKLVPLPSGTLGASAVNVPAAGGTLELAEPASGWSATVNGHRLTAVASSVGGWAQAFRVPSGGGKLTVGPGDRWRGVEVAVEALIVLIVAALALPGARTVPEVSESAALTETAEVATHARATRAGRPASAEAQAGLGRSALGRRTAARARSTGHGMEERVEPALGRSPSVPSRRSRRFRITARGAKARLDPVSTGRSRGPLRRRAATGGATGVPPAPAADAVAQPLRSAWPVGHPVSRFVGQPAAPGARPQRRPVDAQSWDSVPPRVPRLAREVRPPRDARLPRDSGSERHAGPGWDAGPEGDAGSARDPGPRSPRPLRRHPGRQRPTSAPQPIASERRDLGRSGDPRSARPAPPPADPALPGHGPPSRRQPTVPRSPGGILPDWPAESSGWTESSASGWSEPAPLAPLPEGAVGAEVHHDWSRSRGVAPRGSRWPVPDDDEEGGGGL